jgi:hypothetical protein
MNPLSWLLLAFFAIISIANAYAVVLRLVTRKHISAIPLLGGLTGPLSPPPSP